MRSFTVILAFGSNKGDKKKYIESAYNLVSKIDDTVVIKKSSLYLTKPMGTINQENYLNSAILIKTKLVPYKLLKELKKIEEIIGRKKSYRWGPREIDIDIIEYIGRIVSVDRVDLKIPHIGVKERDFVLIPVLQIVNNRQMYLDYYKKIKIAKRNKNKYVFSKI